MPFGPMPWLRPVIRGDTIVAIIGGPMGVPLLARGKIIKL
jgi:hypothetical protein